MSGGDEQDPSEDARGAFHVALATAFFPVVLVPLEWWLLLRQRLAAVDTVRAGLAARSWRGRLRLLVAWDTLVALAVVALTVFGAGVHLPGPPPAGTPRMGVQLDPAWPGAGARVADVWPSSPADDAGLVAGDVIVTVDGSPVVDWKTLSDTIAGGADEGPRMLGVDRMDGARANLRVVPRVGLRSDKPLFGPEGDTTCREAWTLHATTGLWPVGVGVLLIIGLWLWTRRGPRASPGARQAWGLVVVPLVLAPLVGLGVAQGICASAGGWSIGAVLVGTLAQGLALLIGGAWLVRALRRELETVVGPKLTTARASRLAIFYITTVLARGVLVLAVIWSTFPASRPVADSGASALFDAASGPWATALVLFTVAVVAPIAEELVFRGVLLPGLARRMRPALALIATSVVFALFHVPSHGVGAVMPGLLGLVFGWARLRTGGLTAPIVLHAANNLFVSLLALS